MKGGKQNDWIESREAKTAALIFPGIGYHHDKPLLYYAGKLLAQRKIPIRKVDYGRLPSGKENLPKAVAQVQRRVEELAGEEEWAVFDRLILIGKAAALPFLSEHSIVFSGTADPLMNREQLFSICREKKSEVHFYEAANHSLETGEALRDLERLQAVMELTETGLEEWLGPGCPQLFV